MGKLLNEDVSEETNVSDLRYLHCLILDASCMSTEHGLNDCRQKLGETCGKLHQTRRAMARKSQVCVLFSIDVVSF
jgi:hypothetical protein